MNRIVAFTGYARSGKDTCANIMINKYGFTLVRYAGKLYEMLATMLDTTVAEIERMKENNLNMPHSNISIRRALQTLGTEYGRNCIDPNIWCKLLLDKVKDLDKVVIPDLRFINEATSLLDYGEFYNTKVKIIRVNRKTERPQTFHDSEKDIELITEKYVNEIIYNNFDKSDLYTALLASERASVEELSKEDAEKLKKTGLLYEFYPEYTGT